MNPFSYVISASLSPNTENDDLWCAIKTICSPWKWKNGRESENVMEWFRKRIGKDVVLFNSGRSALLAILHVFGIGSGDDVIVQAFTCVAVPNSVRWVGASPVYADIDDTYNIDPEDIKKKITNKTRAIIVQHTFGKSADMKAILLIAKKYKLFVIEDFAHTMSLPMQGDAAFFSFGRDKVLSSVWGGGAVISAKHKATSVKLNQYQKKLPMPGIFWIFQQLLHPIAFAMIIPTYNLVIGKIILVVLQTLKLLSFPVYPEEKKGRKPSDFPARYPNALASLLFTQLCKLDRYTFQRTEITKLYGGQGAYLRFPMRVENPEKLRMQAKREGILIGNWYHAVIDPIGVYWDTIGYIKGSCPKAEDAAGHIINLPTRVNKTQARKIVALLGTIQ